MTSNPPQEPKRTHYPLEEIRALPIVDVAKQFGMGVIRRGWRHMALCPAHPDRSLGSMVINARRNTWHCFSCGSGGSVIDLIQHHLGVEFQEAIEAIAEEYDIEKVAIDDRTLTQMSKGLKRKEYEELGLQSISGTVYFENGVAKQIHLKEDDWHDIILRGKLTERMEGILMATDQLFSDAEVQDALGLPFDELPEAILDAKEYWIMHYLDLAERGFFNPAENPFPSVAQYRKQREEEKKQSLIEIVLAHKIVS